MNMTASSIWMQPIEVPLGMVLIMVMVVSVLFTLQCLSLRTERSAPNPTPKEEVESVPKQATVATTNTSATSTTSPVSRRALSSYRMEEERVRGQSSALSRRGPLWTHKATWHLPQAPLTATRQHEMYANSTCLEPIKALLSSFQVDPFHGFLPSEDPLQRLPYARYHLWEDLADDIPKLLGARLGQVREPLRQLPVLSTDRLSTEAELRRAHLLLCVFAHAYVWGGNAPMDVIPEGIAKPLWEVSERLGIPPVLSHTSLVLYNWRRLDSHADICIENLATLNNFFNGRDESWFYLITAELEARGGNCVIPVMLSMDAIGRLCAEASSREDGVAADNKRFVLATKGYELYEDTEENEHEELIFTNDALMGDLTALKVAVYVTAQLHLIAQAIQGMQDSLLAMREGCHPFIFYHRVRPFLSGWKHNPTLPNGVLYEGVSDERQQFFGGSAAQSPLLPFLDVGLGIEHHSSKSHGFLLAMRDYMLKSHRDFLTYIEKEACIRSFVLQQLQLKSVLESKAKKEVNDVYALDILVKLQQNYDECVFHLEQFRTGHISIVAEYIMAQQKDQSGKKGLEDAAGGKGTGGTELMKFLKPLRDDCTDKLTAKAVETIVPVEVAKGNPTSLPKQNLLSEDTSSESPSPVYLKDNGSSDDIDVFQNSANADNHRDQSWSHPAHR